MRALNCLYEIEITALTSIRHQFDQLLCSADLQADRSHWRFGRLVRHRCLWYCEDCRYCYWSDGLHRAARSQSKLLGQPFIVYNVVLTSVSGHSSLALQARLSPCSTLVSIKRCIHLPASWTAMPSSLSSASTSLSSSILLAGVQSHSSFHLSAHPTTSVRSSWRPHS